MALPRFKNTLLTFGLTVASMLSVNEAKAQRGVYHDKDIDKENAQIRTAEAVNEIVDGAMLYDPNVIDADNVGWESIWENSGRYRLNDGGRSKPRYDMYIKGEKLWLKDAQKSPYGSELSLEEVKANETLQQMSFHYGTWNVKNTDKPVARKKGERPDYYNRDQFVTQYVAVYEDSNGDLVIDPKEDRKVSELLVIRTPHVIKGMNRTYNLTTYMYTNTETPYQATFGAFVSDGEDMLVYDPNVPNAAMEITFESQKAIDKAMRDGVYRAGSFVNNGARNTAADILYLMKEAQSLQPAYDMSRHPDQAPIRNPAPKP